MAVFLALGLGIMIGSSVVSDTVERSLRTDATEARADREQAQEERDVAVQDLKRITDRLTGEIAPWALDDRLEGEDVVIVADDDEPDWQGHVTSAFEAAGARQAGSITLTEKWKLETPDDTDDLLGAMERVIGGFEPGADPAATALKLLGESFVAQAGARLVESLEDAGFLTVQGRPNEGAWPPPSALVVVVSSSRPAGVDLVSGSTAFTAAVADATPTLAVTNSAEGTSVVTEIRKLRDDATVPDTLSTFDAASDADDPGGIGVVAAFLAATEGRGGDFGTAGDRFIAPPSSAE